MIPAKIKDLFTFIEFLHSNIDNFRQYQEVEQKARELHSERWRLPNKPKFSVRTREEEIESELDQVVSVIVNNIENPIKSKAEELGLYRRDRPETILNWNSEDVGVLLKTATIEEAEIVLGYTKKYLEFREAVEHTNYLTLGYFFSSLNELVLTDIHSYFSPEESDTSPNIAEPKTLEEIIRGFSEGKTFVTTAPNQFEHEISLNQPAQSQPEKIAVSKVGAQLINQGIVFSSPEILEKFHSVLKGFFQGKEVELLQALKGEALEEKLVFPLNQNRFVELFKRAKYNGVVVSANGVIKDWIIANFLRIQKDKPDPLLFNAGTVMDILSRNKGLPPKSERICMTEWLQYKSPELLEQEKEQ
jgi:hypothetical protein